MQPSPKAHSDSPSPGAKATLFRGFPDLDEAVANLSLTAAQELELQRTLEGVRKHRNEVESRIEPDPGSVERASLTGLRLRARGTKRKADFGGHYLEESDVESFESEGVIGPFSVMSRGEAGALRKLANELHERDFANHNMRGPKVVAALKRTNLWNLNYSGHYQALRIRSFWEALSCPEVAHRLASLLGDDVLCWRSQFFEKTPGASGTFWHQNSLFRESSAHDKLQPTTSVDPGMVQLSVWIALTDVTIANGALRMIPGTFSDRRLENYYSEVLDDTTEFLARLPEEEAERLLKLVKYSPGNFLKAQAVFWSVLPRLAPLLDGKEVRDLEMRAGEAIIFTELNLHGSNPNVTDDQTRLALGGRFTANDVLVYPGQKFGDVSTPEGKIHYPLDRIGCLQVHGTDRFDHNKILAEPQAGVA